MRFETSAVGVTDVRPVTNTNDTTGILLLSYGTPQTPDDMVPYMTSIRGGRVPSDKEITTLKARYDGIGQWKNDDIRHMTSIQGAVLRDLLNNSLPVYIGYQHMHPSIEDAVNEMSRDGLTAAICIMTAPFYSTIGAARYEQRAIAAGAAQGITMHIVKDWWHQIGFVDYWTNALSSLIANLDSNRKKGIIFSGHSLSVQSGAVQTYVEHMKLGGSRISSLLGIKQWKTPCVTHKVEETNRTNNMHKADVVWTLAWQSAGPVGYWLGPTVEDTIDALISDGYEDIIFAPFGFVSDHVEVLYDNDCVCKERVLSHGGRYFRLPMPNGNRLFIEAMAHAIEERVL